jgi:soluble lytic murein transglycosylase-like protein
VGGFQDYVTSGLRLDSRADFRSLLLCACLLSACSVSGGGLDAVLDPELPATMSLTPESREAALGSGEGAWSDEIAAQSYAGPTPQGHASEIAGSEAVGTDRTRIDDLISRYAEHYGVPEELVRRVVRRESNFNPAAYARGNWGLMQIKHQTARTMGYDGPANGLLDAETNLRYAVRYLRGAWLVAGGDHDRAVRLYARGYYYDAKRKGLLQEAGLRGNPPL